MMVLPTFFLDASRSERLGIIGVMLIAFFGWVGVAGGYIGLTLVLLATLMNLQSLKFSRLWCLTSFRCLSLLILYVLAWEVAIRFILPEGTVESATRKWLLLLLPWLVLWFFRFPQLVPWALVLAALGLLSETVTIAIERWDTFTRVWEGGHVFVAKAWGLYLSTVVLGLIVFSPRIFSIKLPNRFATWGVWLLYSLIVVWMFQCLFAAQTRTAWASFFVVLAVVLVLFMVTMIKAIGKRQGSSKVQIAIALFMTIILTSIITVNFDSIKSRLSLDHHSIEKILSGDENLTYGSATYRYLLSKYGVERWRDSPLFGLGPQSAEKIIKESTNSKLHQFSHFHNGYVEVLVQLGILGLALLLAALLYMLYELFRAYFAGLVAGDYVLFISGVFIMIALWSILNYRMLRPDWLFYWLVLLGVCQSFGLRRFSSKT